MRKLSALFILIVVFFPLAFAAMTLTSIRPWVLDRGFYERIATDERLYEALLADELPYRFNRELFTAEEQLPVEALSSAVREVVTPDYLQAQSLKAVNEVFDYIEGRTRTFELTLDIAPIKAVLEGEGRTRFAAALAAGLLNCSDNQSPIAPGGRLTRCIAAEGSVDSAAEQIAAALPAVLEDTPNQIVLSDEWYIRMNWYDYDWLVGRSVIAGLDFAILTTIFMAISVGFVGAYMGGDDLRGRLRWFSSALFSPASLFLFIGLVLTSAAIVGPISNSIAFDRYSETFRDTMTNVVVAVVQQVGSGFLMTGAIACLLALSLLISSWVVPASGQQSPKMVQIPLRNI